MVPVQRGERKRNPHWTMNAFVLDTSAWAGFRDQCMKLSGAGDLETRLESQIATMKLMCCARMPKKVGVVHMGWASATLGAEITSDWRRSDTSEGFLGRYSPRAESLDSEYLGLQDPRRLARALRLCLSELRKSGHLSWKESDLFVSEETTAKVTVFLCSPLRGLAGAMEDLLAARAELERAWVEVEFLYHPNALSSNYDAYIDWVQHWSPPASMTEGRSESDFSTRVSFGIKVLPAQDHQQNLSSEEEEEEKIEVSMLPKRGYLGDDGSFFEFPDWITGFLDLRSGEDDMDCIETVFSEDIRTNIVQHDFVETCTSYHEMYFSDCVVGGQKGVTASWKRCWPCQAEEGGGSHCEKEEDEVACEGFPETFWKWEWGWAERSDRVSSRSSASDDAFSSSGGSFDSCGPSCGPSCNHRTSV